VFSWFVASKATSAQGAAPNGGPATQVRNSRVTEGWSPAS
jgi:hypothetical protein